MLAPASPESSQSQLHRAEESLQVPARANAVSRSPASPPFPAGPGRFPGCCCAAEHGHHPAAASPALHPGVRCLPLRINAGHGEGVSSHRWRWGEGTGSWAPPPIPAETPLGAGGSPEPSCCGASLAQTCSSLHPQTHPAPAAPAAPPCLPAAVAGSATSLLPQIHPTASATGGDRRVPAPRGWICSTSHVSAHPAA